MERMILMPVDPRPAGVPRLIHCEVNPADIQITRDASLDPRAAPILGQGSAILSLGYGREAVTCLRIDLLFEGARGNHTDATRIEDVRRKTAPLYRLAERPAPGIDRPSLVDLIWGKDWAFRGTLVRMAERLDAFTSDGTATRAWVRLELQGAPLPRPGSTMAHGGAFPAAAGLAGAMP